MSIRFSRIRTNAQGVREATATLFDKNTLLIGRGSECDLILEGRDISLRHAKFTQLSNQEALLEDCNSLSGVSVEGALVREAKVKAGDRFAIGQHHFVFEKNGELSLLVSENKNEDLDYTVAQSVAALSLAKTLPSRTVLSLCALGVTVVALFVPALFQQKPQSWSSGKLTRHHAALETNCAACHGTPFAAIGDNQCQTCHSLSQHGKDTHDQVFNHSMHGDKVSCVSCHREHNGEKELVVSDPQLCVSCHRDIKKENPETLIKDVVRWDTHPQFSIVVSTEGREARIPLDTPSAKDSAQLAFNHAVHLKKELVGAKGPVTLSCQQCHALSSDRKQLTHFTFAKQCQECHRLTFDESMPDLEVPHGAPDQVYPFLYAQYAMRLLAEENKGGVTKSRQRPGESSASAVPSKTFARAEVEQKARFAEKELFTKTACRLCHEIQEVPVTERSSERSFYSVVKPNVTQQWLPKALFSHGAHQSESCASCHKGMNQSKETADLHLPSVARCQECHSDHPQMNKVDSPCIMCHSFHDPLPLKVVHE